MNQQKGENDRRIYFMINLNERMLLDLAGIKPELPDHQSDMHLTEPLRPAPIGDNLHEMSNPVLWEKYFNVFSIETRAPHRGALYDRGK